MKRLCLEPGRLRGLLLAVRLGLRGLPALRLGGREPGVLGCDEGESIAAAAAAAALAAGVVLRDPETSSGCRYIDIYTYMYIYIERERDSGGIYLRGRREGSPPPFWRQIR